MNIKHNLALRKLYKMTKHNLKLIKLNAGNMAR